MFGTKKQLEVRPMVVASESKAVATVERPGLSPQAMHTLQMLQETVQRIQPSNKHLERLFQLTGSGPSLPTLYDYKKDKHVRLEEIARVGFVWRVDRNFIMRFRYHAEVRTRVYRRDNLCVQHIDANWGRRIAGAILTLGMSEWMRDSDSRYPIFYTGDMPDFALDRLEKAMKTGFSSITIHSNEPLQVEMQKTPALCDPVLIGWVRAPIVLIDKRGMLQGVDASWRGEPLGIVIAAWDFDKEIALSGC